MYLYRECACQFASFIRPESTSNSILGGIRLSVDTGFRLGGNDSEIVISIAGTVNRVQHVIRPCVVYFMPLCCPIFCYLYALFIFFLLGS